MREDAGLSPTEAAKAVGVDKTTWWRWENGLSKPQPAAVAMIERLARGEAAGAVRVPVIGQAPAGPVNLAEEQALGYVEYVPRNASDQLWAIKAVGTSMVSSDIPDGSIVICRSQNTAQSGQVVVAKIAGEVTIKRLRFKGRYPYLVGDQGPIYPDDPADLEVVGLVLRTVQDFEVD